MRILIVSQYFWPENFRINDLAAEMVRRGHCVTVLTGLPNYPNGSIFPAYRDDPRSHRSHQGVEIVRVPIVPRGKGVLNLVLNYLSFAVAASVLGPIWLAGRRYDTIFCCQLSPVFIAIPALVLRACKRVPVMLWVLDLWPESLTAVGAVKSRMILSAVGVVSQMIYRRCDLLLGQSRGFQRHLVERCGDPSKVKYLPSWAEDVFDVVNVLPDPSLPVAPHRFTVLFAGNVGDAQDFPAVLHAAGLVRMRADVRWVIVGDGRRWEWVRDEIGRRGLQDCMVLAGRHPLERMPGFYAHADVLLVPLKADPVFALTIPGKVQSYFTTGLPILAMLDGEGARVVRESGGGFACASGDADRLAELVVEMAGMSREQRMRMGKQGMAYSRREFGRKRVHDRFFVWADRLCRNGMAKVSCGCSA